MTNWWREYKTRLILGWVTTLRENENGKCRGTTQDRGNSGTMRISVCQTFTLSNLNSSNFIIIFHYKKNYKCLCKSPCSSGTKAKSVCWAKLKDIFTSYTAYLLGVDVNSRKPATKARMGVVPPYNHFWSAKETQLSREEYNWLATK